MEHGALSARQNYRHCCSRHGALGTHLFIFDMVSELYLFCQFGVSETIEDNLGFSTPKFKVRGLV